MAPNRLNAKTINSPAKPRFTHGFAESAWSPVAPNTAVTKSPTIVNVAIIPAQYINAPARFLETPSPDRFEKKLTVTGTIGNTHGVNNASSPIQKANNRYDAKP